MGTPTVTSGTGRVLPRGRHAAPRAVVRASQRERLLDAMADAVAHSGYAAVRVSDVIGRAGVSRKTFYEQFADREDCFLAAFDHAVGEVIGGITEAMDGADAGPFAAARAGTRCYLEWLASSPAYARTFMVEVLGAGAEALRRRSLVRDRFTDLIESAYEEIRRGDLALPHRPRHVFRACTGAIDELVTDHMLRHGVEGVVDLLDAVLDVEFGLLLGPGRPDTGW